MIDLVASTIAEYRRAFALVGETVSIRRGTSGSATATAVRARVKDYAADELVGDIAQGDRRIIIMAEDVPLAPPLAKGDRLVVRGQPMVVQVVDDNTRRVAGVLIAYEVRARGH